MKNLLCIYGLSGLLLLTVARMDPFIRGNEQPDVSPVTRRVGSHSPETPEAKMVRRSRLVAASMERARERRYQAAQLVESAYLEQTF